MFSTIIIVWVTLGFVYVGWIVIEETHTNLLIENYGRAKGTILTISLMPATIVIRVMFWILYGMTIVGWIIYKISTRILWPRE